RALHILFRNPDTDIAFNQVWQRLILPPDEYVLNLQYRLDEPGGGELVWRVRCMDDGRLLGAGLPLQGQSDWTSQQFSFRVPRDPACQAQLLRLEGAGGQLHERVFSGGVWLDALVLEPKLHLTTARTAGSEAGR
ncbi:MAG: hypothetical protein KDI15_10095, partial [Thiothrix sp.]|nr:hypothetical protein [Thiothrix sp.]